MCQASQIWENNLSLWQTDEPIYIKPYPLPHAMQSEVEKELDTMLKLGVIEPSTSSYGSPIVVVRKPMDQTEFVSIFGSWIKLQYLIQNQCRNLNKYFQNWKGPVLFNTWRN